MTHYLTAVFSGIAYMPDDAVFVKGGYTAEDSGEIIRLPFGIHIKKTVVVGVFSVYKMLRAYYKIAGELVGDFFELRQKLCRHAQLYAHFYSDG